jgi:hypothetical protein
MNVKIFFAAIFVTSTIFAADPNAKPPQAPPRQGEIPRYDGYVCFTGHEKRDHGKRIAEAWFDNGMMLWLEVTTEEPLAPICGQ